MINITTLQNTISQNTDQICLPKEEMNTILSDMCKQIQHSKPIIYFSISILLNIIEYIIAWFILKKGNIKFIDYRFNSFFYICIDLNELFITTIILKYIMLFMGLLFMILGASVYV